jgi:hypothetical protein
MPSYQTKPAANKQSILNSKVREDRLKNLNQKLEWVKQKQKEMGPQKSTSKTRIDKPKGVIGRNDDFFSHGDIGKDKVTKKQEQVDTQNLKQLLDMQERKIYEIEHVQMELEEMTESEGEIE